MEANHKLLILHFSIIPGPNLLSSNSIHNGCLDLIPQNWIKPNKGCGHYLEIAFNFRPDFGLAAVTRAADVCYVNADGPYLEHLKF